jgi:dTMP kinase
MAKVIALIGIDGSGKSTQAELLYHALKKRGLKVRVIYAGNTGVKLGRKFSFYLSLPIDVIAHRLLGLRDKSALLKYRALLKLEDLLLFLNYIVLVLPKILLYKRTCDFLITDRYVYDYVISMLMQKRYSRTFMKILLQIVPRPTITILLDTDPFIAYQRKGGENPVNELLFLRPLYYRFVVSVGGIIVDASGSKAETINGIWKAVRSCISQE